MDRKQEHRYHKKNGPTVAKLSTMFKIKKPRLSGMAAKAEIYVCFGSPNTNFLLNRPAD